MLSPLYNTFPTFTIGSKVGLSISTSLSSGRVSSFWAFICKVKPNRKHSHNKNLYFIS